MAKTASETSRRKRVLDFKDLYERKGIRWSRPVLRRKMAEDGFPVPYSISDRRTVWWEHEVDAWLDEKARERLPVDQL